MLDFVFVCGVFNDGSPRHALVKRFPPCQSTNVPRSCMPTNSFTAAWTLFFPSAMITRGRARDTQMQCAAISVCLASAGQIEALDSVCWHPSKGQVTTEYLLTVVLSLLSIVYRCRKLLSSKRLHIFTSGWNRFPATPRGAAKFDSFYSLLLQMKHSCQNCAKLAFELNLQQPMQFEKQTVLKRFCC